MVGLQRLNPCMRSGTVRKEYPTFSNIALKLIGARQRRWTPGHLALRPHADWIGCKPILQLPDHVLGRGVARQKVQYPFLQL